MAGEIHIKVEGIDKILRGLQRFPQQIQSYIGQAGSQAAEEVLNTKGLRNYPPATPGAPQAQYWTTKQRKFFFAALRDGRIEVPYRRGQSPGSQDYQAKWHVERKGMSTEIGNIASYAHFLTWDDQAPYMANRGWRKIKDVIHEKMGRITHIYQSVINKLIRDLGL